MCHADGQTDRRPNMTRLRVAIYNLANEPKRGVLYPFVAVRLLRKVRYEAENFGSNFRMTVKFRAKRNQYLSTEKKSGHGQVTHLVCVRHTSFYGYYCYCVLCEVRTQAEITDEHRQTKIFEHRAYKTT